MLLSTICLPSHQLVAVSSTQITVYTIPALSTSNGAPGKPTQSKLSKGKVKDAVSLPTLELVKALEKPQLPSLAQGSTVSFRAARYSYHRVLRITILNLAYPFRYHPDDWTQLFAVLNTSPARGTRGKRGAYVVRWNTKSWEITKSKKIADAGITCMDIRYARPCSSPPSVTLNNCHSQPAREIFGIRSLRLFHWHLRLSDVCRKHRSL
jgi:prolactin regulatory element-binding protein